MSPFVCPLCKQSVSKRLYDKITGIWTAQQEAKKKIRAQIKAIKAEKKELLKHFKKRQETIKKKYLQDFKYKLQRKTESLNAKIIHLNEKRKREQAKTQQRLIFLVETAKKETEKKAQSTLKAELKKSLKVERDKSRQILIEQKRKTKDAIDKNKKQIVKKFSKRINSLQNSKDSAIQQAGTLSKIAEDQRNRIKNLEGQLARETTPQIEGLLYEKDLMAALKKEFSEDIFENTGKGGDIIHKIISKGEIIGLIVYECKRVQRFQTAHIIQTAEAKLKRNADYGILVTSAKGKGHVGFSVKQGVIIVHPAGILPLVKILRQHTIQIADMKLGKEQRNEAVRRTLVYLESAEFTNSLDTTVQETLSLREELKKEIKEHNKNWWKRYTAYKKIFTEGQNIKAKTGTLLSGREKKEEMALHKKYPKIEELTE